MQEKFINYLRCPVSRSRLTIHPISYSVRSLNGVDQRLVNEALLFSDAHWFYPVIEGIPRLTVEAFIDYDSFLRKHLADYDIRKDFLINNYGGVIHYAMRKNARTKKSFSQEWSIFNYSEDKTWNEDANQMMKTFLSETDEELNSLAHKTIFDVGCGHGLLAQLIAQSGAFVLGMDLSESILRAYKSNTRENVFFIQGDIQFPPVDFGRFDIVHCSGVLMFTNNSELSFSCLTECVKEGGKASVWLYHPRKTLTDKLLNLIRRVTSKLPIRFQYYLYKLTIFPISFVIKKLKGNKQNAREMMVEILDTLSHQFRWEHEHTEAETWFTKRNYHQVKVTTDTQFGFNIIGTKKSTK